MQSGPTRSVSIIRVEILGQTLLYSADITVDRSVEEFIAASTINDHSLFDQIQRTSASGWEGDYPLLDLIVKLQSLSQPSRAVLLHRLSEPAKCLMMAKGIKQAMSLDRSARRA